MTRSKVFEGITNNCYYKIIKEIKPTIDLKITTVLDSIIADGGLTIDDDDYKIILKKIKKKLKRYLKLRTDKNSVGKFTFSKSDDDYLLGIAKTSLKYEAFPDYYRYLISMEDNKFEYFSGAYLNLIFSDSSIVTRQSADGGIDFIGKASFTKKIDASLDVILHNKRNIYFRIVGQSKRYNPSSIFISTKEIREFFGSAQILQNALSPNYLSAWKGEKNILRDIKLADPFMLFFITSSYFSFDAIDLSNKLGVFLLDVDDIIFDLIEKEIGLDNNSFNIVKIDNWINNYSSQISN